jgi:hypothetical protein
MERIEQRLAALGIALPRPPRAIGNFAYGIEHGGLLYLSGTYGTAVDDEGNDFLPISGKLGKDVSTEDGYRSARLMAINHLAMAKAVLGISIASRASFACSASSIQRPASGLHRAC